VCTAGCGFLAYRLLVDRGRLLLRIDELERRLRVAWDGELRARSLPAGSAAPDFNLPDLEQTAHYLSDWRERQLVLVFVDPACGACQTLLEPLADALTAAAPSERSVVLVSTQPSSAIEAVVARSGRQCSLLIDSERRAFGAYRIAATPSAYTIARDGAIERPVAVGTEEILELVSAPGSATEHRATGSPIGLRPVSDSKLNRAGLPAGTLAPEFDLPRINGGRLSLREFRGRRLLLVFSDPVCGPCVELAPRLERLHRESDELAIAVISRGDPDANRVKATEHGLTYPIALQRHWSTSRDYGMFATPAAYLIDAAGVTEAPVAFGRDLILTLAEAAGGSRRPDLAIAQSSGGSGVS
jgi:peroxiredoxin